MPLLYASFGLIAVLYLTGFFAKIDWAAIKRSVYQSAGVTIVFGAAFLLTRNLGAAALASVVFSMLVKNGRISFGAPAPAGNASVSLNEAYKLFGLRPGASREEIQAAYWRIMKRNHPDQGGSTYLAAKINEAKNILLKASRAA